MRVTLATRIFAPEPAAAAFRLRALVDALHHEGAVVTVLTTTAPGAADDDFAGVQVLRAPVLRDRDGYVLGYFQYLSFDVPLFFRLLFARRPDVVVVEPPPTTGFVVRLACAIRRVPYVYYAADVWSDAAAMSAPRLIVSAVRMLESFALRGASGVLSVSQGVTARLAELGVQDTVTEVGNGVDTDQFSPDGHARELGSPYFLYAGTASEIQGAAIFIHAFERVLQRRPDARLVFVGQGADRARLANIASGLPEGSVLFEPRVPPSEAAEWLRGATASLASVRPGVGYDFALPTKMYASVACGTPVVFAGVGPSRDFVTINDVGIAVPYDIDALAAGMEQVLESPPDAERRRAISAWAAQNVSLSQVAERACATIVGGNLGKRKAAT